MPNPPDKISASEQSISRCFEAQAALHGDALAISAGTVQLTYAELNRIANRQAHQVAARNPDAQLPIGLLLDQGAPFIAALLAVLKAGGFFVALDPHNPPARNAQVLQDAGAHLLLTGRRHLAHAQAIAAEGCAIIDVDGLPPDLPCHDPDRAAAPDALACLLYTSGSTGRPKGVAHDHRSLLHNALRHRQAFRITQQDRQTLLYSCGVYGGIRDILNALLHGASLHTYSVKQLGVAGLAKWLCDSRITIYCSVATVFRQFAATLTSREQFPDLRLIKLGGEASHRSDVELYRTHFPRTCVLHCGLGSTETGVVRHFFVDHRTRLEGDAIPLGYPIDDMEVRLLDEQGAAVAAGQLGEIVVRSRYIARGYWQRPEQNAAAFAADTEDPLARVYRTGDLGVLRADGCLEHRGRKDSQVKIRGNRVEIAEVECALRSLGSVAQVAVAVRADRQNDSYLVAYVVVRGEKPTVGALRSALAARLPETMIPSVFMLLDALPQTPSGKIDRQALPAPDAARPRLAQGYASPRTSLESSLAATWAELMGLDSVGVQDDFFELGGNSLVAVKLMALIRARHGQTWPLSLLFEARTVRALAETIARGHESGWSPLVPIRPHGRRTPLFCVHPGGGNVLGYQEFVAHLDEDQPVYGIQAYGVIDGQDPHSSVPEMARLYLEVVREVQPHGPYYLGGESFGGLVAYEMACQLTMAGERVDFLFLGDVWTTGVPQFCPWRYALARITYPLSLSWSDWREIVKHKLRGRRGTQMPTKRYLYADALHRRNSLAHRQASRDYRAGSYPGKMTLFRALATDHSTRRLQHYFGGPDMGWRAVCGLGVEVHWMPDVHHEMMHSANARGFARTLQACIDRAAARRGLGQRNPVLAPLRHGYG